jgi:hypothetical protein
MIGALVLIFVGLPLLGLFFIERYERPTRVRPPEGDFYDLPPDQLISFTEGFITSEILDDLDNMFD